MKSNTVLLNQISVEFQMFFKWHYTTTAAVFANMTQNNFFDFRHLLNIQKTNFFKL